jgi:hypothetical protein
MQRYPLAALAVVGASVPAPSAVSAQLTGLLSQFPAGGDGLRAAVAQLVEADPSLVDEVVFAGCDASPSQKEAIGRGLAGTAGYFGTGSQAQ